MFWDPSVCVCSIMSDCLRPHELEPARLLCPWDSQARILEWVGIFCSRGSSQPRDWTCVSGVSCIDRRILYHWDPWWLHTAWHGRLWQYKSVVVLELRTHELTKCIHTKHTHTQTMDPSSLCLSGCLFACGKSSRACQFSGIIKLRRATHKDKNTTVFTLIAWIISWEF